MGFILIIFFSIFLRFWNLGLIPEGFHADEAAFGYNAYSVLETGKDEYSQFFPLVLRSFDDYKGAIYSYIDIPFVKIFGLNELAVRFPSAVFGVLLVILGYLVVEQLTKSKKLSLLTSLLLAISPLSILLSRVQSDPLIAVFFVILGFYFILKWIEKKHVHYLLIGNLFWVISFFTYASSKVFLPIFIFLIFVFYVKKLDITKKRLFLILSLLVILLDIFLVTGLAGKRFNQLNIFSSPQVKLPLEEKIREDGDARILFTRLFHNKLLDYSRYAVENYSQYLSFNFLFLRGGLPTREIIPDSGILYLVELPFLFFGIFKILKDKIRWGFFIILWFLSVPAVLSFATDESPNAHRFFLAVLPIELIVAFGILSFFNIVKNKKEKLICMSAIIGVLFVQNLLFFLHQLFIHQPIHNPIYRGYVYKELVATINNLEQRYKKIVITKGQGAVYIYILFYNKYSPRRYQMLGSPRDYAYKGFDKYYFHPSSCPLSDEKASDNIEGETNVLYVNHGECKISSNNVKLLKTIYWKNGSPAFKLVEYIVAESGSRKQ